MSGSQIRWMRRICLILFIIASIAFSIVFANSKNSFLGVRSITVDAQVNVEDCFYGKEKNFDSEITVVHNGTEIVARNGVLIYPDKTTYVIKTQAFVLNQVGHYILRYFYNSESLSLVAEKTFDIYNNLYSVSEGEKTSVYDATKEEQIGETLKSINDNITATKENGLIVRLEDGNKFSYSKPVELSETGLASIIRFDPKMFYFEEGTNSGYTFGHWIADGLKIRLTDCYDSTIYIETTITTQASSTKAPLYAYDFPYVRASTNNLPNSGIELPSTAPVNTAYSKEIFVDGERGLLYASNYGTGSAGYLWMHKNNNGIEILFDRESARLYCRSTVSGVTTTKLVADFTNTAYGNLEYQPFTTGEAYLSVEFCDYRSSEAARIDIYSIGTDDGEYLVNPDNYSYQDDKKPIINVDFNPTKKNYGYISVGEYYSIPSATSIDINSLGSVDVAVYKNYESAYKTIVSVEDDRFLVSSADAYTIEYTALDKFGNVQVETIKIYGVKQSNNKKTVNVDIGTKFEAFNAGEEYILPKPVITTLNDDDRLRLLILLSCPEKQNDVLADLYGREAIESFFEDDCSFVPLYAGEYKIEYQFADNMMDYSKNGISYIVECSASNVVNFLEKPFLERYLIKDAEYSFDWISAYNFSTGEPIANDNVTAYIRFDESEYKQIDDLGKVKITGMHSAQLKFVCSDVFVESDIAEIVDVNYAESRKIKIEKYFVQEEFGLLDGAALVFKTLKTSGDASMSFANRIGYQNLSLKFMVDNGYSDYRKLNIILTEPTDLSKRVVISFYKDLKDNFVVSVNNGKEYVLKDSFSSSAEKVISYNAASKIITISNCEDPILVDFGFTSSTVYLDIECIGLNGRGGIRINSINNQNFGTNVKRDNKTPEFYDANPCRGTYPKNAIVDIHPVIFYDVLSPILNNTISVKVTDVKGNCLTSIDGILLDGIQNDPNVVHAVKFTEFGEYYVDYVATDLQGNICSTRTFIVIKDCEKPILNFVDPISEGATIAVSKGETLVVGYTLTDDTSSGDQLECYITVMDMNSHYIYGYRATNQISFSYQGHFEVTFTVRDAAGNYTIKSFFVVVS